MRTLGPRSISSALKIILDVVFFLLLVLVVLLGVWALFSAVAMIRPGFMSGLTFRSGRPILATTPRAAAALITYSFNVLASIVVVGRLRGIFATLIAGAPFQSGNARRLRIIGLALVAAETTRLIVRALLFGLPEGPRVWLQLNFVGWFAIAIIFVLAEVFEEGARLRREAELTI